MASTESAGSVPNYNGIAQLINENVLLALTAVVELLGAKLSLTWLQAGTDEWAVGTDRPNIPKLIT